MFSCNIQVESHPQLTVEGRGEDDEIVKAIKQINLFELYEADDKYKLTLDEIWADLRANGRDYNEEDGSDENERGYQQNEIKSGSQSETQSEIQSGTQSEIQSETQSLKYYDILDTFQIEILNETQNQRFNFNYKRSFRRKRNFRYFFNSCVFCENNNEPEDVVRSHAVRDLFGRVLCPKLRVYICPICGESGDNAHTIKYCPKKKIITMEQTMRMHFFKANYLEQGYGL